MMNMGDSPDKGMTTIRVAEELRAKIQLFKQGHGLKNASEVIGALFQAYEGADE